MCDEYCRKLAGTLRGSVISTCWETVIMGRSVRNRHEPGYCTAMLYLFRRSLAHIFHMCQRLSSQSSPISLFGEAVLGHNPKLPFIILLVNTR